MNQKKVKRSQLYRLQELQRKAFDAGLNMEINTRMTDTDTPWIVGRINEEGADLVNDKEGTVYLYFYIYDNRDFWTKEKNIAEWEAEFNKIEEFIERRK